MCCEEEVDGLEVPAQIKEYVNAFFAAVDAAKILKECGGYSIANGWHHGHCRLDCHARAQQPVG